MATLLIDLKDLLMNLALLCLTFRGSSIIQLNFSPGKSGSRHMLNI